MQRLVVPLVIAGSLAVLVALFILMRAITAAPAGETATSAPRPTESATPDPWANAAPTSPAAPGVERAASRPGAPSAPSLPLGTGTGPAPTGSSDGLPGTRFNTKNLNYGLDQLIVKITQNAPHVHACLAGSKATGEATLTFIAAQKAGKIIIEQTDADRDKTTVQDETLLSCLQKTAEKIQLDGLPREAEAIIVTRVMTLENGTLAADKVLKFSYLR